jgi:hypothetical protein
MAVFIIIMSVGEGEGEGEDSSSIRRRRIVVRYIGDDEGGVGEGKGVVVNV